jgi:hypothetical protein
MVGTLGAVTAVGTAFNASLTGAGALSGVLRSVVPSAAGLAGAGTLSATGIPRYQSAAALTGTGTLTGTPTVIYPNQTAPLTGAGALTTPSFEQYNQTGPLTGDGALSATARLGQVSFVNAAGGFTSSSATTISITLDCTGASYLVVFAELGSITTTTPTTSCTVGSTAMTSWAKQAGGSIPYAYGEMFVLANPPTGSQTITFTTGTASTLTISAHTYSNVSSIGTAVKNSGSSSSLTSTAVSSAANHMVAHAFCGVGQMSGYTGTGRYTARNNFGYISGDLAGAASVTFTATTSTLGDYVSLAVDLSP